MGAWIEIKPDFPNKSNANVAPFMGAWIEIKGEAQVEQFGNGRALHGRVD